MFAVDEILVLHAMQNSEQTSGYARPLTAGNSFSSKHLAITIIIAALISGAGGYLIGQRATQDPSQGNKKIALQPSPTSYDRTFMPLDPTIKPYDPEIFYPLPTTYYPVPTINPTSTANWKTYTSEKYGFSFRYPPHVYANAIPRPVNYELRYLERIIFKTYQIPSNMSYERLEPTIIYENYYEGFHVNFSVTARPEFPPYNLWPDPKEDDSVIIGGKTGRIFSRDYHYEPTNETIHDRYIILPLKENDKKPEYIQITYNSKELITIDEFNQILSTFKFTDQ